MFTQVNDRVVTVDLGRTGPVVARRGAMLFYTGQVQFTPHHVPGLGGGGGLGAMAGRMLHGEHEATMLAQGTGSVHYGFRGIETHIVDVSAAGQLRVEASRLLAYTSGLQVSVVSAAAPSSGGGGGLRGTLRGAAAGVATGQGMSTTQLSGHGFAVVLGHGGFLELQVTPDRPVMVDPQAYVAALGSVTTTLKSGMSWRNVARSGGENIQLECTGHGVVLVQASEEKL
ncbi:AIM24 family protein [Rhodococcus sp. W8901]|uniref:AIM24 family protein n=1 Tax=Rhodococcus sp. W8901 TaxID=2742603 RepID=UPI001583ABC9|nr:AIM24 family protein [Rhodococcus sp. W8901]QKT11445.1 AIM24 family protein [Rhodococcus sp. W8901]